MKLHEIINLGEIDLFESGDRIFKFEKISSEAAAGIIQNVFSIDTNPELTCVTEIVQFRREKIGQVSFYVVSTGSFELVNKFTPGQVSSVIATVIKICEQYTDVTTWFFTAKMRPPNNDLKTFGKRSKLYNRIALRYAQVNQKQYAAIPSNGDMLYIVSDFKITREKILEYNDIFA